MEDIFEKEGKVIAEAELLIHSGVFRSAEDEEHYGMLLLEYKKMLRQMKMMVRMSDIMQSKLNSLTGDLEKLSRIDGLTGLYNRRFFNETYLKEWNKAAESRTPLGLLMIDIDYFKRYNDTYGHLEGDQCLQKIADAIGKAVSGQDFFTARFGGEEFIVLLLNQSFEDCVGYAEKILDKVDELKIPNGLEQGGYVTISIGIGYLIPEAEQKSEVLINQADQALYRAKKDGRHCCRS